MGRNSAKLKLASSLKKLMEKTPLDRISVTDIVKGAGVTRQTFYRHFRCKCELVNWYFDVLARQCFDQMGVTLTLREGLILKFDFIRREKGFFAQAFNYYDCNSIGQHDYEFILKFYTDIIREHTGEPLSDEIRFLLELYCHGSISMTAQWAINGMSESSETLADCLIEALPSRLAVLLLPPLGKK